MTDTHPRAIRLSPEEEELLHRIDWSARDRDRFAESSAAARVLTLALLERGAIPSCRWAYFVDPQYAVRGRTSRREIFERNGTSGEAIYEHPHFLKHLRYMVFGPDLPSHSADGFARLVEECSPLTSGDIEAFHRFARGETRKRGLERREAADEFYKLAIEFGMEQFEARQIRGAVMSLR